MSAAWTVDSLAAPHGFFGASADYATAQAEHRSARSRAMANLGAPAPTLFVVKQVHSNRVVLLGAQDTPAAIAQVEADALIGTVPGQAVGVLTADCVPILIEAADIGYVAAVHAGRVGALGGILEQTVLALEGQGALRNELALVVGPHIASLSYEVGRAMYDGLPPSAQYVTEDDKFCCDLAGLLSAQIHALGIAPGQVVWSAQDTLSSRSWHSYRRDGAGAGRNLSAIAVGVGS